VCLGQGWAGVVLVVYMEGKVPVCVCVLFVNSEEAYVRTSLAVRKGGCECVRVASVSSFLSVLHVRPYEPITKLCTEAT